MQFTRKNGGNPLLMDYLPNHLEDWSYTSDYPKGYEGI